MIPKILQQFIPPIIGNLYSKVKRPIYHRHQFLEYWQRVKGKLDSDLVLMVEKFINSPSYNMISDYWLYMMMLNIGDAKGINGLAINGFENFKQSINNYFTALESLDGKFGYGRNLPNLVDLSSIDESTKLIFKRHELWSWERSINYNIITLLQYYYQRKKTPIILDEPLLGNAPYLQIDGRIIAQDCLNSALEYKSITGAIGIPQRIVEYGAGCGRTAYYFLKLNPKIHYTIVDIPPALYISKRYLTTLLPKANVDFMLPHEYLDAGLKDVDLTIGINCMQEMNPEMFETYMKAIRATSKYFYTKMLKEISLPFTDKIFNAYKMPIPNWQLIFVRECEVPAVMVERLYKI